MFCNDFSSVFHMFLQMFQTHVSSVSSFVFRCMLQIFYLDVSKVDLIITHVAMVPMAGGQRPAIGLRLLPRAFLVRRALPSPLLSSPSLPISPPLGGERCPTRRCAHECPQRWWPGPTVVRCRVVTPVLHLSLPACGKQGSRRRPDADTLSEHPSASRAEI
jgi:hypothetical protein